MEFGSDFHLINYPIGNSFTNIFPVCNLYASGRQALLALTTARNWKRLWIPSYFCEESLNCFRSIGTRLLYYPCIPTDNPGEALERIDARYGDGVLVVNYFGLHGVTDYTLEAEIVEDHTHNLISKWSTRSRADWCIASLRKTLPIPDGGILWSPKGLSLPPVFPTTNETEEIMGHRFRAMCQKAEFVNGLSEDKTGYLRIFNKTEESFDRMNVSGISHYSLKIISEFDIEPWYILKKRNYETLKNLVRLPSYVNLLSPQDSDNIPFSFCLLFPDKIFRDNVRNYLINHQVYPAVLWNIKSKLDMTAKSFGDRILSIHCDGRYSPEDMILLSNIIKDAIHVSCNL